MRVRVYVCACIDYIKMPSLPQGAFAACKLREQLDSKTDAGGSDQSSTPKLFYANKKLMEYSPVKYNEKFMNAIWGHYNRYSPHNIKSNDAAGVGTFSLHRLLLNNNNNNSNK